MSRFLLFTLADGEEMAYNAGQIKAVSKAEKDCAFIETIEGKVFFTEEKFSTILDRLNAPDGCQVDEVKPVVDSEPQTAEELFACLGDQVKADVVREAMEFVTPENKTGVRLTPPSIGETFSKEEYEQVHGVKLNVTDCGMTHGVKQDIGDYTIKGEPKGEPVTDVSHLLKRDDEDMAREMIDTFLYAQEEMKKVFTDANKVRDKGFMNKADKEFVVHCKAFVDGMEEKTVEERDNTLDNMGVSMDDYNELKDIVTELAEIIGE